MRKRLSRKQLRKLVDGPTGSRRSRDFWVSQEFTHIYLWLVFIPFVILLASLGASGILEVLFYASALPLLVVYSQSLLSEFGVHVPGMKALGDLLDGLCQFTPVKVEYGEYEVLVGFERVAGLVPKRGRLILTNRRLLFQRPRWFFLPPWRPRRTDEIRLNEIVTALAAKPRLAHFFRPPGGSPNLTLVLSDGSRREFSSMMARTWRRYILRACRDGLAQSTHS
jgi:hypothetical protein